MRSRPLFDEVHRALTSFNRDARATAGGLCRFSAMRPGARPSIVFFFFFIFILFFFFHRIENPEGGDGRRRGKRAPSALRREKPVRITKRPASIRRRVSHRGRVPAPAFLFPPLPTPLRPALHLDFLLLVLLLGFLFSSRPFFLAPASPFRRRSEPLTEPSTKSGKVEGGERRTLERARIASSSRFRTFVRASRDAGSPFFQILHILSGYGAAYALSSQFRNGDFSAGAHLRDESRETTPSLFLHALRSSLRSSLSFQDSFRPLVLAYARISVYLAKVTLRRFFGERFGFSLGFFFFEYECGLT